MIKKSVHLAQNSLFEIHYQIFKDLYLILLRNNL